jgi:Carboxypeptidase regulatory-like domain
MQPQPVPSRISGMTSISSLRLLLVVLVVLSASLDAMAVTFNISPASVPNSFTGTVELKIIGVSPGGTVRIEKYLDENADGQIEAQEPLLESFLVTDGLVPIIGGITNVVVHADHDGSTNGQIIFNLDFSQTTEIDRISGQYLFKVSDPSGSFSPLIQPFALTATPLPQGITGLVTDASTGKPIPSAQVALVDVDSSQFVTSVFDNADGRFTAYSPPGNYLVLPLRRGYIFTIQADIFDLSSATLQVSAGQFLTNNVILHPGSTAISGIMKDAATGAGIPGVAVYALSGEQDTNGAVSSLSFTFGLTDESGNFSVMGQNGIWGFASIPEQLARIGYLGLTEFPTVTVTNNIGTNVTIALPKATSLIYGQVKNQAGKPLAGVQVAANDSDLGFQTIATTDTNGNYTLGAVAGNWSVEPDSSSLDRLGYQAPDTATVLVEDATATEQSFSVQPVPLSLSAAAFSQSGSFQFQVTGESANSYQVQSSSDLKTWTMQGSFTISTSPYLYIDESAKTGPTRFYRVQRQP